MTLREFVSWEEATSNFDSEDLRQLVILKRLPAFFEMHGATFAYAWPDDDGEYPKSGSTGYCEWQNTGHEEFDEGVAYALQGWFHLPPQSITAIFRSSRERLDVYLRPAGDGETPDVDDSIVSGRGFRHVGEQLTPNDLWFRVADLERLGRASRGQAGEIPSIRSGEMASDEKPLGERERTTLLCMIGALARGADLSLDKPHKAATALIALAPELTLGERTVGEHLKKVAKAMESRKG